MKDRERRLAEDRAIRVHARALFDTNMTQVKADLAARGIGGRIADKAKGDAIAAGKQALDIAKESKGIIAATAGALGLWLLRKPLLSGIRKFTRKCPQDQVQEQGASGAGNIPEPE